jgi:hypothetical protein
MENRGERREKAGFHGIVRLEGEDATVACAVRDLSGHGARLSFLEPTSVPDSFRLALPALGETCRAEVRWRRGLEVGVAFSAREPDLDLAWAEPAHEVP